MNTTEKQNKRGSQCLGKPLLIYSLLVPFTQLPFISQSLFMTFTFSTLKYLGFSNFEVIQYQGISYKQYSR
jgi:hypothetical protein